MLDPWPLTRAGKKRKLKWNTFFTALGLVNIFLLYPHGFMHVVSIVACSLMAAVFAIDIAIYRLLKEPHV